MLAPCADAWADSSHLAWRRGRIAQVTEPSDHRRPSPTPGRVRLVAHDEPSAGGADFDYQPAGRTRLKSIVVHRDESFDDHRIAQLPDGNDELSRSLEDELLRPLDENFDTTPSDDLAPQPALPEPTFEQPRNGLDDLQRQVDPLDTFPEPRGPDEELLPELMPGERAPAEPYDDLDDDTMAEVLAEERKEARRLCRQELSSLKDSRLHEVELEIAVTGTEGEDYPFECEIHDGSYFDGRSWCQVTYMWKASALCHKPLYFEDVQLERYGHSWGPYLQPIVSGAHFFSRLPVLPYCMGYTPPHECMYTLGYYRPGNCAPYMIPALPISPRGALFQAGAVVGTAAILP